VGKLGETTLGGVNVEDAQGN